SHVLVTGHPSPLSTPLPKLELGPTWQVSGSFADNSQKLTDCFTNTRSRLRALVLPSVRRFALGWFSSNWVSLAICSCNWASQSSFDCVLVPVPRCRLFPPPEMDFARRTACDSNLVRYELNSHPKVTSLAAEYRS